jgi:hypothetical protein
VLLALLLSAAPTAADAEAMASKKQWDELYLAWAAQKPDAFADADKKRISKALAKGCAALAGNDAVMAQSLGEKAVMFSEEADAMVCAAKALMKNEQRSDAEAMLRTGKKLYGNDDRFSLELGRMLLTENDASNALAELRGIGPKSKVKKEATALIKKAMALEATQGTARADLKKAERQVAANEVRAAGGLIPSGGSSSYESGVDEEGRRTRGNQFFRFRYFNGQRDFGQRADYEGRVQQALEEARQASNRLLGQARQKPTDVILYSKTEFTMHHGAQAARSIAGFYSENAIRMNDSAEINAYNQAVLVHEYVHAVIDEAGHFHHERIPIWMNEGLATWVEWRFTDSDGPPPAVQAELRGAATRGSLPSLRSMARQALITMGNVGLAYHASGAAVHLLIKTGGPENLMGLFDDVGGGAPLDATFQKRYGRSLAEFEEKLADELKSR